MRLEKALKIQTRDLVTFNFCHYVSCILSIIIINAIPKGKKTLTPHLIVKNAGKRLNFTNWL